MKLQEGGRKVAVATLFSKGLPIFGSLDLYQGRRREDDRALAALGVSDPIQLGLKDAPFRNLFYHNFQRVILEEHPRDRQFAKELGQRVALLYKELAPQTVFLPLAVGTHIDHRHTHCLWCALPAEANIVFYEDRPYSFLPHNLQLRLKELGADIIDPELAKTMAPDPDQGWRAFGEGLKTITMYKNVLKRKRLRFRYILSCARAMKSPQPAHLLTLEAENLSTGDQRDILKIQEAVRSYKSQIPMLFNDMETFTRESAAYNRRLDGGALYCERYWRLLR